MPLLINAYCTARQLPPLSFPHRLRGRRDISDPALGEHLNGFIGFIMQGGEREMTSSLYAVMRHLQRVQHHLSLEIEDKDLDAYATWAIEANAICFLPDSSVVDTGGRTLVHPETGAMAEDAVIPYPPDAHERKARSQAQLAQLKVRAPASLPPVIGECEARLRSTAEVQQRALALLVTSLRGESLATGEKFGIDNVRERMPQAIAALSPNERAFFDNPKPEQQEIVNAAWRYEGLYLLEWAIGMHAELAPPTNICDVPLTARTMLKAAKDGQLANTKLRPASEILDALDLTFRLHWACVDARINEREAPSGLEPGVIAERHYALNWLINFEDADWDDVDTPT
jgi:hypothetical protein